jgi:hypothetical protein
MNHGQAHNMADVMGIYTDLFAVTAVGLEQLTGQDESALFITQAEIDGITAYLENRMRSHGNGL